MKTKSPLPAEVDELRQRLERWRQRPRHPRRLPEPIWAAATDLAGAYGISALARSLRLSYDTLKQRVLAAGPAGARTPKPGFVEVAWVPPACGSECTVELKDRRGSTMSIRLAAGAAGQVVALAQAFWRGRS
jgi:hypothetical protein